MVNDYVYDGYNAMGFVRQRQAAQASLAHQQALNGHQQALMWYELYSANRPLEREDGPW